MGEAQMNEEETEFDKCEREWLSAEGGTLIEETDKYVEILQTYIEGMSKTEQKECLLKKVRYWFWSAMDWRDRI